MLTLSGVFTDVDDRSQALEDGSDAYLVKPVAPREPVAMARALLRITRAERRSEQQQRVAEELRRRVAQSRAMVEVARSITTSLDVQRVLERIVDEACELLGARRVGIAVLEPGHEPGPSIRFRAVRGLSPAFAQRRRPLTWRDGTTPRAIRERRPAWTADILDDPAIELSAPTRAIIKSEGYRAVLSVPLLAGERVIGAIVVYRDLVGPFSDDDIEIMQVFAAQAAVALGNAELYGEAERRRRQAEEMAANLERSQAQLVKTERLRALGEMAAGVAHDFNNLLSVILGRAELLLRRVGEPATVRDLEAVRRAAQDGAETVRRIQEFTRTRRTRAFERVDLAEVAREVVELTRPRWELDAQSRGVRYEFTVEGAAPPVAGRPEELREVLANLVTNAVDAMPEGGRCALTIGIDGEWAVVTVRDTGIGMDEETRRRVFEPFFSSKGPRGTGLGLAVSWGIVTRHGGTIEVQSEPGRGSTFAVRLPIPIALPDAVTGVTVPPPVRAARVLIIEDEPDVHAVLADILREAGYVVSLASDGGNGLARCEEERVDIVLSDISMPGLSGWDVAARVRERFPLTPIGFVTGWGDQLDPDRLARTGVNFVIAKPFQTLDVLRHVAEALSASR